MVRTISFQNCLIVALLPLALAGCAGRRHAAGQPARLGMTETGDASWYGDPYHGRPAANGEVYDMDRMTAAHRTLPFGTWVRVRNVATSQAAEVRITDRGPFVGDRIIDLSRAAARQVGVWGPGVAKVQLTVIRAPEGHQSDETYAVQVGAFASRDNAERLRREMERRHGEAVLSERPGDPAIYRVLVGRLSDRQQGEQLAARIRKPGQPALVVRLD